MKVVSKWMMPLIAVGMILAPYIETAVSAQQVFAEAQTAEKQTVQEEAEIDLEVLLDEDYAKVEGGYIEKENALEWTIQFEKKASTNEGRIRLAIDTAAAGIGTVKNVRGQGLSSYDSEGTDLKTEEISGETWYVGKVYSTEAKSGTLTFETEKGTEITDGELPLQVVVDEKVQEESADEEVKETDKEIETSKTEDNATQNTTDESVQNEDAEKTNTTEQPNETNEVKSQGTPLVRNQSPLFAGILERLGPTATNDPYKYIYPTDGDTQHRYPYFATNDYTKVLAGGQESATYTGDKGELYENGNDEPISDEEYQSGGANWRNYNYATDNGSTAGTGETDTRAPTVQLWGNDRTFANSYLDYSGAYIKKWVEPVLQESTSSEINPEDNTTLYNVYLDVIGGENRDVHPVDVVFVLDKSASMNETTGANNNQSKNNALEEAVVEISRNLLSNPTMDARIGMVNFYSEYPVDGGNQNGIDSNTLGMTNDINRITNRTSNTALYRSPEGGTPLSLGLRKGYEILYEDDGEAERNPEKILIVVGDGIPTFSYGPIQSQTRVRNTNRWGNWGNLTIVADTTVTTATNNIEPFRNFETYSGNTSGAGFNGPLTYPSDFDRPADEPVPPLVNGATQTRYYGGEVKDGDAKSYWIGNGTADNSTTGAASTKEKSAAINTVAYHHWLKNKMTDPPNIFTIGLGIDGSVSGRQRLDAIGRNVLQNIADSKDDGTSYYYNASNKQDIVTALESISSTFTKTIRQATLYDETGFNVSLFNGGTSAEINYYHLDNNSEGSVRYQAPELWDEEKHGQRPADVVAMPTSYQGRDNHAYKFSPISLGEGEMVRIKYQVKLDGGAQDGNFYTVNNLAYIQNQEDYENNVESGKMFFPAPSIRFEHPDRNLQIKKTGEDGQPLAGVLFGLYDADPSLSEANLIEQSRTTDNGQAIFNTKINVLSDGEDAISNVYWVKEMEGPERYELVEEALKFQIKKHIAKPGETLGHYELTAAGTSGNRVSEINDTEGDDPDSYFEGSHHKLSVVQKKNESETDFAELFVQLEMKNEYKPVQLNLKKVAKESRLAIDGAEFSLYETNGSGELQGKPVAKGVSGESKDATKGTLTFYEIDDTETYVLDENGQKKVYSLAKSGSFVHSGDGYQYVEYRVVETKNPAGYQDPVKEEDWLLQIQNNDRIRLKQINAADWTFLSYTVDENDNTLWIEFEVENTFLYREVRVKKLDANDQLLNGAGFTITKENDASFPAYRAYTGNPLEPNTERQADGIGYFYAYRYHTEKYADLDYDIPLRLMPGEYTVTESVAPSGYQLSNKVFQFEVNEEGNFIVDGINLDEESAQSPTGYQMIDDILELTLTNDLAPIELTLEKLDSVTKRKLEGASFSIEKQLDDGFELIENGLAVDENDSASFISKDLAAGNYRIIETKAPEGYRKLPGYFLLTISYREQATLDGDSKVIPGKEKGSLKAEIAYYPTMDASSPAETKELTYELIDNERIALSVEVGNDTENPLPATGGQGRQIFMLISAILVGLAGIVGGSYFYYQNKRKKGLK
ncbi:SpaA isopeptide-forming pilin-related protein [Enterococcus thailandicus]|uniref:SpaA isopeptide-forming pilin-related protein n=1 Tax=Enterococcus thailandicus TaxID=417368 RepID=UPI003A522E43